MKQLRDIPFSVLDLSPILQGGTAADALHRTLDLAQHTERLGFHRYWLAEHHGMPGIASAATAVVIGHVAGGTSRIRVGSGGIMLSNHAPLVIAEQFGTLESLYPGRIDLGLGRAPGSNQPTMRALRRRLDIDDGEEFPQQLEELRAFFRPRPENSPVRAVPGEGLNVPIWLLGSSTFSAQLAGILGLPFAFAGQFSPAYMQSALELYRLRFAPSEVLDKPYVMVGINVFAADTDEEAQFLATSHKQQHVNLLRGTPKQFAPPVKDMDAIWSPPEKASVENTLGASLIGGPETVREGLEALLASTQADELMINAMIYDHGMRKHSYDIVDAVRKA
jgi:luciferase family oxidoreductase group 1